MRINKPWWKAVTHVVGFEGEGEGGAGTGGNSGGEGGQSGSGDGKGGEGGSGEGGSGEGAGKTQNEDTSGLKSALEKERNDRKALEKELKAFRKSQQEAEDKEKSEVQRLTDAQNKSSEKLTKLAAKFRESAIEQAIISAARTAKFTDPTDALRREVLQAIGVEQDEDDPTKVDIDTDSVTKAVKDLAKAKPHYLAQEKQTPPPSGPKFGGSGRRKTDQESQLSELYPALRLRG